MDCRIIPSPGRPAVQLSVRPPDRRGYVLVSTLLLLALAGLAMVSASRRALNRIMESRQAELELQQRWGTISLQATLLAGAETILTRAERNARESLVSHSLRLSLNGRAVRVLISDEQAKANVNTLLSRGALEGERLLREVGAGPAWSCRARSWIAFPHASSGGNCVPS